MLAAGFFATHNKMSATYFPPKSIDSKDEVSINKQKGTISSSDSRKPQTFNEMCMNRNLLFTVSERNYWESRNALNITL